MALTSAYLTSVKNFEGIMNSILGAKAPDRFTNLIISIMFCLFLNPYDFLISTPWFYYSSILSVIQNSG